MRARALNPQVFLESLCYAVFGGLLLYLLRSGEYLSYVTPRMEPYLYFAAAVLGIWALSGLGRLFRPQHKIRSAHCFVLAIPILLLLLPHSPLSASDLTGNYAGGNPFSGQSVYAQKQTAPSAAVSDAAATGTVAVSSADTPVSDAAATGTVAVSSAGTAVSDAAATDTAQASSDDAAPDMTPVDDFYTDLPGLDEANRRITVSNENFGRWLSEIYENMQKYEGYTVVMTGFVFRDAELMGGNEFLPARLMMSCCVADLSPAGLVCRYDKASELKEDSWVTVEGTLFIAQLKFDGQEYDDPELDVTKITPAEEAEGYIYPYY